MTHRYTVLLSALVLATTTGCASTAELSKVSHDAKQAQQTADQALEAAREAQQTASAADERSRRLEEMVNRSFKKSMYK